jgi:hypothetical protein
MSDKNGYYPVYNPKTKPTPETIRYITLAHNPKKMAEFLLTTTSVESCTQILKHVSKEEEQNFSHAVFLELKNLTHRPHDAISPLAAALNQLESNEQASE